MGYEMSKCKHGHKINSGNYVELTDRIHVAICNIDEHILKHIVVCNDSELTAAVEDVIAKLTAIYQLSCDKEGE